MTYHPDPALVALCGSATRVSTLAALAGSTEALTGYRVAKMTGIPPVKIYRELRRLLKAGLVRNGLTLAGRTGFEIADSDVAELMRKRARLVLSETWFRDLEARIDARDGPVAPAPPIDLSKYRANPDAVPNRQEFERPASKGIALARAGLQVSRRKIIKRCTT
jgi:predicted transcriptional regulator